MLKEIDTAFAELAYYRTFGGIVKNYQLEEIIDNFCQEAEKEVVLITFNDAWKLALSYPEKAEIKEAVKLVKQLEQYFESNGKIHYEQAKRKIEKLLSGISHLDVFLVR